MKKKVLLTLAVGLFLLLLSMSVYTVDRAEFVYVTQFGKHIATHDGANDKEAGLHFKWPWPIQSVQRVDRRLQVLDLPAAELVTADPRRGGEIDKTLTMDAYVVWRIPDSEAVDRFIVSIGTTERAREILRDRVRGLLGAAIAKRILADLINDQLASDGLALLYGVHGVIQPDARAWNAVGNLVLLEETLKPAIEDTREELRTALLEAYRHQFPSDGEDGDGIEVIDIRLRRQNYPDQVRQAIFQTIISERNKKVAEHQNRGREKAEDIRSNSESTISRELARVKAENEERRGETDAKVDQILTQGILKNPEYYAELQRQKLGQLMVDRSKVFSTWLFRLAFPTPKSLGGTPPASTSTPDPKKNGQGGQ